MAVAPEVEEVDVLVPGISDAAVVAEEEDTNGIIRTTMVEEVDAVDPVVVHDMVEEEEDTEMIMAVINMEVTDLAVVAVPSKIHGESMNECNGSFMRCLLFDHECVLAILRCGIFSQSIH